MVSRISAAGALATMLLGAAVPLAGCGNARTPVPSIATPRSPSGFARVFHTRAGLSFEQPRNWTQSLGSPPLVAVVSSGQAVVAVWRYPDSGPEPSSRPALALARTRLIAAARSRDHALSVIRSKLVRIGRAHAIVLDATELISGHLRRVRSFHLFVPGAEIVLEEYAPPGSFHKVDHDVFSPLNHSLALEGPQADGA